MRCRLRLRIFPSAAGRYDFLKERPINSEMGFAGGVGQRGRIIIEDRSYSYIGAGLLLCVLVMWDVRTGSITMGGATPLIRMQPVEVSRAADPRLFWFLVFLQTGVAIYLFFKGTRPRTS